MRITKSSTRVARVCASATLVVAGALAAMASSAAAAPANVIVPWQDTVAIEHADRRRRLQRLSGMNLVAPPEFHESLIGRSELPPVFGVDIPVLRVVFPQRVFFDTAADSLRPEAERVLDIVAAALSREAADTAVFIAGHTDSRGDDAYNYDLSVRRAQSVAESLKGRGIRQVHIWRVGFGEAVPREPNTSEAGMARNRRVEFLFARKPEAVAAVLAKQGVEICRGSAPAQREQCRMSLAALPRVEALPVITGPRTTGSVETRPSPPTGIAPPVIDVTGMPSVTPSRSEVGSAREPSAPADLAPPARVAVAPAASAASEFVARPSAAKDVAIIRPTDPVVIDVQDVRVFVNRPKR